MFKVKDFFPIYYFKRDFYSPDRNIRCHFELINNVITYSLYKDQVEVIKKSQLGLKICGETTFPKRPKIVRVQEKNHRETVELPWGEEQFIENNYSEFAIYIAEESSLGRLITIRFRLFDDEVAFRYEIPPQPKYSQISIKEECSEFNLSPGATIWRIPAYQPDRYEYNYEKGLLADLLGSAHTPFTAKLENGIYLSIHEAALYNYGAMNLKINENGILASDITPLSDHTKAHVLLPFSTPWRVVMLSNTAIGLTTNHITLALNDPPDGDFSWVKTIKFIGIWWAMFVGEWTWSKGEKHGATTEHAKEYIDAAVRLGISGLLIEGWNEGWEGDWLENGAYNSFLCATPDFDLESVASYAKKRKVEIIGHHETVGFADNYERQLEEAYNFYARNGVNYIKTGYAGRMMKINGREEFHHSQAGVKHYQKTVELAAKKHICLDIHEPIKGTGIERTWPNLLTREGARGQEYEGGSLSPSHACNLPYTRLLAGGMDYTSGILDLQNNKKSIHTTLARQLAYFVTIYSAMQMAADRPFIYEERFRDEFKFIRDVPTSFSRTLPLAGEIGEYYIVARKDRYSSDWYIGGITNEIARKVTINLSFLEAERYRAECYTDATDAHYQNNPFAISKYQKIVAKNQTVDVYMAPGGGFAVRLVDISAERQ